MSNMYIIVTFVFMLQIVTLFTVCWAFKGTQDNELHEKYPKTDFFEEEEEEEEKENNSQSLSSDEENTFRQLLNPLKLIEKRKFEKKLMFKKKNKSMSLGSVSNYSPKVKYNRPLSKESFLSQMEGSFVNHHLKEENKGNQPISFLETESSYVASISNNCGFSLNESTTTNELGDNYFNNPSIANINI